MRYLTLIAFVLSVSLSSLSGCAATTTTRGPGVGHEPLKPGPSPDGTDPASPKTDGDNTRQ